MKYIFLPGVNDNETDIDGFIRLVNDITPSYRELLHVIISRDCIDMSPLNERTLAMMARLYTGAEERYTIGFSSDGVLSDDEARRLTQKIEDARQKEI